MRLLKESVETVRCWEPVEIALETGADDENPYTDRTVWVDLSGPGFERRVYGFWDGGRTHRVRVVATAPGTWSWSAGSEPSDDAVSQQSGSFVATDWNEQEKAANPTRRGMLKPTADNRGLELADGAPFLLLGDTWWSTPTYRYRWDEDRGLDVSTGGTSRPAGAPSTQTEDDVPARTPQPAEGMSFQDMVEYRKAQGFNSIAILAGFPHWANDGASNQLTATDGTPIRSAWRQPGTDSAKDMHNAGGRPFEFPGRVPGFEQIVPDLDRINPAYFRELDLKIEYLNARGFVPFIETARRDISEVWKRYHEWPESYSRYIRYIFTRLQAFNCILSPIHFDWAGHSIPGRAFNEAANAVIDRYGPPPFGTLLSANSSPSTLVNFGGPTEARWLTLHQTGNWREHDHYFYATELFHAHPTRPALSGEPYYPGFPNDDPPAPSEEATRNFRSGMYGGYLSGARAGYIYGAEGLWGGDIETEARYRMWEALEFESGDQVRHLSAFVGDRGAEFRSLTPAAELITPNKAGEAIGYRGWAFAAANQDRSVLLGYLEVGCPDVIVRSLKPDTTYRMTWFDPRRGEWVAAPASKVQSDQAGRIELSGRPDEEDWGFLLEEEI